MASENFTPRLQRGNNKAYIKKRKRLHAK